MGLEVRVEGAATLRKLAAHIRAEGNKSLTRQLGDALSRAADPVREAIRKSADETLPHRGGYAETFDRHLKFRTSRSNKGEDETTVSLFTYAEGESERRDIRALEAGKLRHPVYGRSRAGGRKGERIANPWSVTSIRAGFWQRGTDHALDEAQKELQNVINEFADRLIQ